MDLLLLLKLAYTIKMDSESEPKQKLLFCQAELLQNSIFLAGKLNKEQVRMCYQSEQKRLLAYSRPKMVVNNLMHELGFHLAYLVWALFFEYRPQADRRYIC